MYVCACVYVCAVTFVWRSENSVGLSKWNSVPLPADPFNRPTIYFFMGECVCVYVRVCGYAHMFG